MLADLKFYLTLFLRRFHYFLVIALAVSAIGITVAWTLPPIYRSEAQLLVESPQIPDALARSTVEVGTSETLQIIRQRLLTRANLLDIAREFGVYRDQPRMTPDQIVRDMRSKVDISLPRSRRGQSNAANFVTVSFESPNGELSARVANELVTRVLEENVAMRQAATSQTLDFFRQEVARLDRELADQSQLILEFQLRNQNSLPDSQGFRRSQQVSLQEQLIQVDREIVGLKDRSERLQTLYESTGRLTLTPDARNPDELQLVRLQNELQTALTLYSEQNPRIRALRAQVTALENRVAEQSGMVGETGQQLSAFEIEMADLNAQIEFKLSQKARIETTLAELEQSIAATPANAVQLSTLERDYQNIRVQYNAATADLAAARTGDQIEAQARGQRITVVEQAEAPREPTKPDRNRIALMSIGLGVMLGAGFVALLEFLNGAIRRPADLTSGLGITPLVTIPYVRTKEQQFLHRLTIISGLLFVALGIPLILYLLHVYFMPMDLMLQRLVNATGLSELLISLGVDFRN
jgi:uncharacterized protein involved in exopolysaccharide biosynthesis